MEKSITVNLNEITAAQKFCAVTEKSEADVKAHSHNYVVNGKSIMGLFSLDLSQPIQISISHQKEQVIDDLIHDILLALVKPETKAE